MPKLAVVGQPISHSLSPRMHTAALEATGLVAQGWTYEAIELDPGEFAPAIRRLAADPAWAGVNVTIPHKAAALAVATGASPAAREIGAANTLSFAVPAGGGEPAIEADNTDAPALIDALAARGRGTAGAPALVLGAGGSARAVVWALREAGARVTIWNRTHARAAELAAAMGVEAVAEGEPPDPLQFRLLINTTSVGLGVDASSRRDGAELKQLGIAADQLSEQHVVVDLVYGAAETELIRAAKDRGAMTIDGLEILVRQGARSFRIWTGVEAPLTTMTEAVSSPRE